MSKTAYKDIAKQSKLNKILWKMRNCKDEQLDLVLELEKNIPCERQQVNDFCKAYVIVLLEEYCENDDELELMLVSYGLLKGFEFDINNINERINKYWEHSRNYNSFFKNIHTAGSAYKTAYNKTDKIIDKLDKIITACKAKNEGELKLIDKVPDKWELPTPRNNKDDIIKKIHIYTPKENESRQKIANLELHFLKALLPFQYIVTKYVPPILDKELTSSIIGAISKMITILKIEDEKERYEKFLKIVKAIEKVTFIFAILISLGIYNIFSNNKRRQDGTLVVTNITTKNDSNILLGVLPESVNVGFVSDLSQSENDELFDELFDKQVPLKQARKKENWYESEN